MSWDVTTFVDLPLVGGLAASNILGYRPTLLGVLPQSIEQLIYCRTNVGGYFFDAVLREEHLQGMRITEHPVQDGANIADHAYMMPAHLSLEVAMSDAMSHLIHSQFLDSVDAYRALLDLQAQRSPIVVQTRLRRYEDMLIEHLASPVDVRTSNGLRCHVVLKQIITATVARVEQATSSDPQTTDSTNKGQVQGQAPTGSAASYLESWALGM